MIDFPANLQSALKEISLEYKITLLKETHFDAIDRELRWFKKNKLYRLNFDFSKQESSIRIFYHMDIFPLFPKFLVWCHDFIPMFPYYAKIVWKRLSDLPSGLTKDEYKEKVKEIIKNIN